MLDLVTQSSVLEIAPLFLLLIDEFTQSPSLSHSSLVRSVLRLILREDLV